MQISPRFEEYLNSLSSKRVHGDTYEVRIFSPWAIRYYETDHTLTLGSEVHVKDGDDGKRLWFLKVYVDTPLAWDNSRPGETIMPKEAILVIRRIEDALKEKGERYELTKRNATP